MDKKRMYNILFHLHTVSGIVISAVLFVMFFCGAFTMFKSEIEIWEEGSVKTTPTEQIDFDKIYAELGEKFNLTGRNINFNVMNDAPKMYVFVDHSHLPNANQEDLKTHYFSLNLKDYSTKSYEEEYTYSEFLYRLHFLSQIPTIGGYLAGFVSVFFLFALLTGLYIHWDKIVKNFVLFRPKANWKTIWTDSHTVLGTIGFPFQLIFAFTGAYFCLSVLVLLPAYNLYNNDYENLMQDVRPERSHAMWQEESHQKAASINQFVKENIHHFQDFEMNQIAIENINGTNMEYEFIGELNEDTQFTGVGSYAVNAYSLEKLHENNPYKSKYVSNLQRLLSRLHFGDYGGVFTKFIYAFLAFLTCFIIISGVMVWLTARKKKNIPEKNQKFNFKVVNVYLAICLSMLPVTALGFIATKLMPSSFSENQQQYYYLIYFICWLIFSVYFILKKNLNHTNKLSLLLGGMLFMLIPIVNGIASGNWFWQTFNSALNSIFLVDVFCFFIGVLCFYACLTLSKKKH